MLSTIDNIALIFLTIPPMIFVFGVTLLGTAIDKAKQEEKAARDNESEDINAKINTLEESLKEAKKNGDTTTIIKELDELKKAKEVTNKKIEQIRTKYNHINLNNTVIVPTLCFVSVVILNKLLASFPKEM